MTQTLVFDFINDRVGVIDSSGQMHEPPAVVELVEVAASRPSTPE